MHRRARRPAHKENEYSGCEVERVFVGVGLGVFHVFLHWRSDDIATLNGGKSHGDGEVTNGIFGGVSRALARMNGPALQCCLPQGKHCGAGTVDVPMLLPGSVIE